MLRELESTDVATLKIDAGERMRAAGATFGAEPLSLCPVPRLIETSEWSRMSAGLAQRARALSAFVLDAYGDREIVGAGHVPAAVIDDAEGYEPELRGRWPGGQVPLGVIGLDLVRDQDGELLVLEDNTRTPSGFTYAVAAREAVSETLHHLVPAVTAVTPAPRPLAAPTIEALRATLNDAAAAVGDGNGAVGSIVVLTDGSSSSAFFEHATTARWLQAPLVTPRELMRRGDALWLRAQDGGPARPVAAVFRRTEIDALRNRRGTRTAVAELLIEPWLAGRLAIVNPFGAGVADDKLVHAYVEEMVRFYLHEEPTLRSVETLDLTDPATLEYVLRDLRGHVVKPRHGHGGRGVVVCGHADSEDVRRVQAQLREPGAGGEYVAQRTVTLSLHPTVVGDRLAERHIDLRPFTFSTRQAVTVVPGGLTRVGWDAGALIVNSSQDGGAKDTWVLP